MKEITEQEYWQEIKDLAQMIFEERPDPDEQYDMIHETIDSHMWITYTFYHQFITKHTTNDEAYLDIYSHEDLGKVVAENGLDHAKMIQAFWAMNQDLSESVFELNEVAQ